MRIPTIKPVLVVVMKTTTQWVMFPVAVPVINLADTKRHIRRVDRDECVKPLDQDQREKLNATLLDHAKGKAV